MGALALRPADLQLVGGEPRIADARINQVLEYGRVDEFRRLISKNWAELHHHGEVFTQTGGKPQETAKKGGRPTRIFYLNEAQTILVCMFARTPVAAEVRKQIINVFMAYRHGQLVAADANDPWARMERRLDQLERLIRGQQVVLSPEYAEAIAYSPAVLRSTKPDGTTMRHQRRPRFWNDLDVRQALIARHRQMTIDQAREEVAAELGDDRAPSRSAIGRFWLQLDEIRMVH